ncbi:MFS transporter [Paenibacillus taichungensis]|uniref:MFS transporter n=1 Tax=Paenibacillus taichungensis TaxID=484184 RepID=A0ABX2MMR7_9BACL|nr:MFS transporter [Paenibacillus taichungensis]NUU55332.1 MFS transporter [Paenibacillus taichungensis]
MKKLLWIGCLSYFLIGLAHVVLGSILPVALEHYGKDYSQGGTLIFAQFAGFLGGVLLSPWLNKRFGKRGGLLIAAALLCIAELSYMLLPPWGWMFVIAPAAGFGFGMIEAVIGTIIIAAIKDNTAVAMSRLEVLFGIGAMVMPLIASGLISAGYWRMSFLVVAVCAAMTFIFWAKSSFGELDNELSRRSSDQTPVHTHAAELPNGTNPEDIKPTRSTYHGRNLALLSLFVLFFFLYVGTEMSLANFMPAILIEKMNMKEAGAALSVTCFWITMSVGRLFAGYIAEKFQYRVYVLYSCLAAVVLLMIFPFTNQIWSAFLIILLLGLALSGVFSIALVFASKMLPGTEESTPSILIASGGVGGAILPLVTGWSLDHLEVNQSAWMLAIFAVGLLIISVIAYQWQRRHTVSSAS